jgi:hypothetical protein
MEETKELKEESKELKEELTSAEKQDKLGDLIYEGLEFYEISELILEVKDVRNIFVSKFGDDEKSEKSAEIFEKLEIGTALEGIYDEYEEEILDCMDKMDDDEKNPKFVKAAKKLREKLKKLIDKELEEIFDNQDDNQSDEDDMMKDEEK